MIIAIACYALVSFVVFGKALFPPAGQMIFGDDIHRSYYFFREFFNRSFENGVFPWWNPYMFGGEPFIANPIVNIWYPPSWMFSLLPLNFAYGWHLSVHVLWAMIGMYVFSSQCLGLPLRSTKRSFHIGAWVSGLIFGLSGFFMARSYAGHVDVVAAASWIPWVVWGFYKLITNPISGIRIGLASGMFAVQLFAGYQTMAMMSVIIVGILTVMECLRHKRWYPIVWAALAGGIGILLAAIQLLPVQEFFRMSIRTYGFPYSWHAYGSLEWRSFLQLINPFIFGTPATYAGPPPNYIEHGMYIGIVGLFLACVGIVGIWFSRKKPHAVIGWVCLSSVILGFWISLGPNAPIDLQHIVWQFVPMYRYLRIPPRHLILAIFGLSWFSGVGMYYLERIFRKARLVTVLILGLALGEMLVFGRNFIDLQPIPPARHDTALISLLKTDSQPYRVLQNFGVWLPIRDSMDFDSGLMYGIFSATGYDPSILRPYFEYIAQSTGISGDQAVLSHDVQVPYLSPASAKTLDRLNVKYVQVPIAFDPFQRDARYRLVMTNPTATYRVYENTTVLPRFFLGDACGTADVRSFSSNEIEIAVDATCDTTLESSEVWYPGWEAYINGKKTSINKTENVFRTLNISHGNQTIIYRYNPKIFVFGGIISLATLGILMIGIFLASRGAHRANI